MTEQSYHVSRFDLAQIEIAYEAHRQSPEDSKRREYASKQLERIGARLPLTRFDLAMLCDDIERGMN